MKEGGLSHDRSPFFVFNEVFFAIKNNCAFFLPNLADYVGILPYICT